MDKATAKAYFEKIEGAKVNNLLRTFILSGGIDIEMSEKDG